MRLPVPEYSHLRIATRQETYDAIINDQAHTDAKVWRDSIVTYSPLGDIKREVLTLKIIEQIK
jgi:Zn-finger domain-containing protein